MNDKEVAELRRRFRLEKTNITHIKGCYVNDKHELVARFNESLALISEDESERMLAVLKRALSGTLDKNLIDVTFTTEQVMESDEHRLLTTLRSSALENEDALEAFFKKTAESLVMEGGYLILLACDKYDVPFRPHDGTELDDASTDMFTYLVCAICPVKMTKPALGYHAHSNEFHTRGTDWLVAPPTLGFLFPAFDDRRANIYNALYYSRDTAEIHREFTDAIFNSELPMAPAAQKETFRAILAESLADDCSLDVVQAVHERLREAIEEHRATPEAAPLTVSKDTVINVMRTCGVPEPRLEAFDEKYDEDFGTDAPLCPRNLVDVKQIEVRTPNVKIQVNSERGDLVETRSIDGIKYVLIRVDEGVEVNGVGIYIE